MPCMQLCYATILECMRLTWILIELSLVSIHLSQLVLDDMHHLRRTAAKLLEVLYSLFNVIFVPNRKRNCHDDNQPNHWSTHICSTFYITNLFCAMTTGTSWIKLSPWRQISHQFFSFVCSMEAWKKIRQSTSLVRVLSKSTCGTRQFRQPTLHKHWRSLKNSAPQGTKPPDQPFNQTSGNVGWQH